ncbi:MAG: dockerin type I repeat-containing protein [Muribaculaceae bacterium]|nr:dockerin type I repeat-containing protein [Muribaculaceae bacterium]
MKKNFKFLLLALAAIFCLSSSAQLKIKGVYQQGRDDDGEMAGTYLGWNSNLGKSISIVPQGIYMMQWDGTTLTTAEKEPPVNVEDFFERTGQWSGVFTNDEMAAWANDFNLMSGNSGAGIQNGVITTIHSRSGDDIEDSERFAVRKWDALTGNLLSGRNDYFPRSMCLESAGMSVNPVDGKMYGLFYLTQQDLPEEILNDPDFFVDQEGDATSTDAGYCICSIDLETMIITPITPGLYYGNFVTFAINSEGRAFALTSGGTLPALNGNQDVKVYDIDGNLAGAQLYEFDLETGLMLTVPVEAIDEETGEPYTEYVNKYSQGTGYCSQAKRQSACFSKSNPNIMYWVGYVNSGKGYNDSGSLGNLPDREWKTNGKYDTALYEVDITTGEATRISLITNRYTFSTIWVEEDDEPTPGLRGDVNGDGKVDVEDVNATINIILNLKTTEDYPGNADLLEDNKIDVEDLNAIINIILGL